MLGLPVRAVRGGLSKECDKRLCSRHRGVRWVSHGCLYPILSGFSLDALCTHPRVKHRGSVLHFAWLCCGYNVPAGSLSARPFRPRANSDADTPPLVAPFAIPSSLPYRPDQVLERLMMVRHKLAQKVGALPVLVFLSSKVPLNIVLCGLLVDARAYNSIQLCEVIVGIYAVSRVIPASLVIPFSAVPYCRSGPKRS